MERERVVSSSIVSVGYSAADWLLEIEFESGGVYQYAGVSVEEQRALMSAASKGRHVNAFIKPRFAVRRVGGSR